MNPSPSAGWIAALSVLMFVTGAGIPVMAAMNAGLGRHLASPPAATAVLFGLGLVLALPVALLAGPPSLASFAGAPHHLYFGAVFVVAYILSITFAAPRIGLANAVFLVLLGQMVAAATIDHFALLGALRTSFTWRRGFGLAVMAVGLYFARRVD